jgi:hypothetical protein
MKAAVMMRAPAENRPFPRLATRRNYQYRWIWVLLTQDKHVVNRSDHDFTTREECEANALANGQTWD